MKRRCICDNKKGLSQVVTTLLFVLIALGAVLLVWNLVRALITDSAEDIDVTEFNLRYELEGKNLYVNAPQEKVSFVIKRNAGEGEVKGFSILLEDETGQSSSFEEIIDIGELESKIVEIDYSGRGLGKIVKVGIAPILTAESGEDKVASILAETNVPDERTGNALFFNGAGDNVNLGNDDSMDFPNQDITISVWVNPSDSNGEIIGRGKAGNSGWGLFVSDGQIRFGAHGGCTVYGELGAVEAGKWQNILVLGGKDNTVVELYLDGVKQTIDTSQSNCEIGTSGTYEVRNPASASLDVLIGKSLDSAGIGYVKDFAGEVDDVRVYDRALDSGEIAQVVSGDFNGVVKEGLVLRHTFDDISGTISPDDSGNGNDGTINGAVFV